jgi:flagellar protein FliO/FliZ
MRFTIVILSALLCLSARAESAINEKDSDEAILAAAEKMVTEGVKPEVTAAVTEAGMSSPVTAVANAITTTTSADIAQDMKKESEIPVFSKSEKLVKSENSLVWRLVASIGFIFVVGAGLIFFGKRFSAQKNKGGEKARIEVLHQFHMGPKKSVALIRVAGEAILIGCTDHSINMLKSVTLIDDEMEGALGKDFNAFLEDEFSVEDMRTALSPRPRA